MNYNLYEKKLFNPEEGFIKGNLFNNIYNPYNNYHPMELRPTTEKEKCLLELSVYSFAAHELNLYLDVHPEDQTMFTLFQDYQRKANELMEKYERKYGALTISSEELSSSYNWVSKNWPWEGNNA